MKKIFLLIISLVILVCIFTGCGSSANSGFNVSKWNNRLTKSEKIEVVSSNSSVAAASTEDRKKIDQFIKKLEISKWKSVDLDAKQQLHPEVTYVFYERETIKFGENLKHSNELKEVARVLIYKDTAYIDFTVAQGFKFSFEVPKDVENDLEAGKI